MEGVFAPLMQYRGVVLLCASDNSATHDLAAELATGGLPKLKGQLQYQRMGFDNDVYWQRPSVSASLGVSPHPAHPLSYP